MWNVSKWRLRWLRKREIICLCYPWNMGKSSVFIQDIKWSTSSGKHKPKLVHLTHSVPLKTVTVNLHLWYWMPQNLPDKNYIALVPSGNRPLVYMESQKRINPIIMDVHNQLLISIINYGYQLWISMIQLWISMIQIWISIIKLWISIIRLNYGYP